VHGLGYHDLGRGVADLVMRLLVDPRIGGRSIVRRHRLDRWLPIESVGGVPVIDRSRLRLESSSPAARAIASFVLDCADERGLVLVAPEPGALDPLALAVTRELVREGVRSDRPRPAHLGLLLLVRRVPHASPRVARRADSAGLPLGPVA
jgi:hypothetical protein